MSTILTNLTCNHSVNDSKILAPTKYRLPISILQVLKGANKTNYTNFNQIKNISFRVCVCVYINFNNATPFK